jgi:hypothetical protein
MHITEILKEWWSFIVIAFGVFMWGIRLEGLATLNRHDIKEAQIRRLEDLALAKENRDTQNALLYELRSDIKALTHHILERNK